ncbi:MAG: M67 family metallopeptidase [Chloroflexi bacterium]|nr:M67 family metallopeptidase [Chloroflexota bacterium]
MPIVLTAALQARIKAQMESTYPNEGGGFLLGTLSGGTQRVQEIIQINNVFASEEQYHRYAMTPQDWARLEDEADARGLALVGYYHSHPNAQPIPSIFDRDHAWPNFTYLITQVQDGHALAMRAWRLRDDGSQFDEEALIVE